MQVPLLHLNWRGKQSISSTAIPCDLQHYILIYIWMLQLTTVLFIRTIVTVFHTIATMFHRNSYKIIATKYMGASIGRAAHWNEFRIVANQFDQNNLGFNLAKVQSQRVNTVKNTQIPFVLPKNVRPKAVPKHTSKINTIFMLYWFQNVLLKIPLLVDYSPVFTHWTQPANWFSVQFQQIC